MTPPPPYNSDGYSMDRSAIHQWLRRHVEKSGRCTKCGMTGRTEWAFTKHPEPYTRGPADYVELCRRCHMTRDNRRVFSAALANRAAC